MGVEKIEKEGELRMFGEEEIERDGENLVGRKIGWKNILNSLKNGLERDLNLR